jgi:two-component system, OmpR family, phosphate regulon sensor histidine kinase PhoR
MSKLSKPNVSHDLYEQRVALDKMRRDFVANVSHELRTPLTVIHGYLETLLTNNLNNTKNFRKIFTQMYQQTTRMENIIADLLLLSRLENEEEVEQRNPVAIASLLKSICREAKILSGSAHHKIFLEAERNLKILGNENELRSMISNIIFNAVKYTPANGSIFVKWCSDKKKAYLTVRDTGIGIAKKHIPRITERFYRVDKARSRASGGTGLGLAIVKHVLIRHNAQLKITSNLGKGSTFTCIFPL